MEIPRAPWIGEDERAKSLRQIAEFLGREPATIECAENHTRVSITLTEKEAEPFRGFKSGEMIAGKARICRCLGRDDLQAGSYSEILTALKKCMPG